MVTAEEFFLGMALHASREELPARYNTLRQGVSTSRSRMPLSFRWGLCWTAPQTTQFLPEANAIAIALPKVEAELNDVADFLRSKAQVLAVPLPGWAWISNDPPSISARSRMLANPGEPFGRNKRVANRFCYDTQAGSQRVIRAYNRSAS